MGLVSSLLQPQELGITDPLGGDMSLHTEGALIGAATPDVLIDDRALLETMLVAPASDYVIIAGQRYLPHPNGGGLVSVTAFVGSEVFVDRDARVEDNAIVVGSVQLRNRAVVRGHAIVEGRCSLSGDSIVEGFATLTGMVVLRQRSRVGGIARLNGGIVLNCRAHITRGQLHGPLYIE